jgi:molybdopterin-guanine dinucleotide biosynthesis protein A
MGSTPDAGCPRLAGFVLAGGKSTRMGEDKALLPYHGQPLAVRVATEMMAAAGSVVLIGDPDRYRALGLPVEPDSRPDAGPLAGIESALALARADWNLIAACDMPNLSRHWLSQLAAMALASENADCVVGRSPSGLEPLCAAYHVRALPAISAALDRGVRKVTDALAGLQVAHFDIDNQSVTANVNTPEDWARHRG